ncbi:MAG: cytochrome c biogenesis protein CcdA [Mycobacteriales bacterium]
MGDTFAGHVTSGPLLVALGVAALAGLVSFLSPCVLPLVPGYLSYMTGLSGAELDDQETAQRRRVRGRVLVGTALFVLGFSAVFVSYGVLFGGLGRALATHQAIIERVIGAIIIVLGLGFLGLVPGLQREVRIRRLPATGLAGAPLLGVVFGVGWTPCVGPTLGAVQGLAYASASAGRGALLSAAYCLGLGLPFLGVGLGYRRLLGGLSVVRRHARWVTRIGGALLVVLGLLLLTGLWDDVTIGLRDWTSSFTPAL